MDVMFYADIETATGRKLGSGPIELLSWESDTRLSQVGTFRLLASASDEQRGNIQEKRVTKCYAITSSGPIEIGSGIIDAKGLNPSSDGNMTLSVEGDGISSELSNRNAKFTKLESDGNGISHGQAVTTLTTLLPDGWTLTPDRNPPNNDVYFQFAGETLLEACAKVAELSGSEFYINGRKLIFQSTWTPTGLTAIEVPEAPDIEDESTCYIVSFGLKDDSYDLVTRIYPYGNDLSTGLIDLSLSTRTNSGDYIIDSVENCIRNARLETEYGIIERLRHYREIKPLADTSADRVSAANTLFDTALSELKRDGQVARFYEIEVIGCPQLLRPMQSIRVIFRRTADGEIIESINEDLNIIEATTRIDNRGLRTSRLTVSNTKRPAIRDTDPLVKIAKQAKRV
ncbi:MAG: hypothetical protein AAF702_32925 [Chloroflexota bacterium]